MTDSSFLSGFCAVVGRPNVGKSTFLNSVIGQKVTIVSDKPQTTRNAIRCIWTTPESQIVFIDTPGIHIPRNRLGERMIRVAHNALSEVDAVIFMVDAPAGPGKGDQAVAERLKAVDVPVALGLNKMDLVDKEHYGDVQQAFSRLGSFDLIQPLSAVNGEGVQPLLDWIMSKLPEDPMYYPEDWVVDHPERFVIGELIREQALHLMREEVPYAIAVFVEKVEAREGTDLVDVEATIYVERESQKGIIIGKRGQTLKAIGSAARLEIEKLLGSRIHLELWVKVSPDWRDKSRALAALGFSGDDG